MGGDTNLTQPQMQGYGDSMAESLDAQVALLTGTEVGKSDFSKFADIGGLQGITERYEAPLRKATAQIDTDVMRQTLLGGEQPGFTDDWAKDAGVENWETEKKQIEEDIIKAGRAAVARGGPEALAEFTTFSDDALAKIDAGDSRYESAKQAARTAPIRTGDGMVDLVGDKRNVQESVVGADGKSYLQDTGRQAGFDDQEQFMGLSALAEDIGRGGQQRAREADIADVERLGGRATDAYRAQGDLGGALQNARNMGAGGSDNLSAIPSDPLFTGGSLDSLGNRVSTLNQGIDAIGGGRMGDFDPRATQSSTASSFTNPQGQGSAGFQGPQQPEFQGPQQPTRPATGTDAFRSALMADARGALGQGLTAREKENIEQATRSRATALGRAFDTGSIEQEVQAKLLEDRNRQMQNRNYAQSVLGGEIGTQQADLARNLQAKQLEMSRQSQGVDRQLAAEESDVERAMRQQAMGEQFRQSGLGMERANAAQMVGLEQATSADPFQAILQRQGQNTLGQGQGVFSQAGYGLQSAPQYIDPSAGLGFIQNQNANQASMYNAQIGADAAKTAGMYSMIGSLGGAATGAALGKGGFLR
jgi:hypothetical protein